MRNSLYHRRKFISDFLLGPLEMTDAEMLSRIFQALKQIDVSGCDFGRIELIVRDGQVKHVNVSYEINKASLDIEQTSIKPV